MDKNEINSRIQELNTKLRVKQLEVNQTGNDDQRNAIKNDIEIIEQRMAIERLKLKIQQLRDK